MTTVAEIQPLDCDGNPVADAVYVPVIEHTDFTVTIDPDAAPTWPEGVGITAFHVSRLYEESPNGEWIDITRRGTKLCP